jgi:hypothetical protein
MRPIIHIVLQEGGRDSQNLCGGVVFHIMRKVLIIFRKKRQRQRKKLVRRTWPKGMQQGMHKTRKPRSLHMRCRESM